MAPQMGDPLGSLQGHLNLQNGLDKGGEMAVVMLDPSAAGGAGEGDKSMLMLWPVSDYKAFLGNFPDAKEEAGVATIKFGDAPMDFYMTNVGKYALITPTKEITALKPGGLKVKGATAKEMNKDFVMWANMPRIRDIARPKLKENREKLVAEMETQLSQDPEAAKFAPVIKAGVNRFLDVVDQFLAESQAAVYSVNIGEGGINTAVVAEFVEGSDLGKGIKQLKNTNTPLLSGLPEGKYLVFGGATFDPELSKKVIASLMDPITKEMAAVGGDQATAFQKYVDELKKYMGALKGNTFGMIAPSGPLGQEPLLQALGIQWGDAPTLKSSYADMIKTQEQLTKAFGAGDAVKTETKPGAKNVEGVSFDVITSQFNTQAAGPNAAQMQMFMNWMYGPNGATILEGLVGDKLLVGVGVNDATLLSAVKAIKANENPLGQVAGVKTVAAQLPQQRLGEFYVPLDQIVTTIANYAGMMGMNVQMQLPPDLPPIGGTISTDGNAMRVDSYTPTELIKAVVAAGMQTFMQMQGGRQPGGPGGL
jgi:hypothetical protein